MVPNVSSVKIDASHELTHSVNGGKTTEETPLPATVKFSRTIP